MPTIYRIYFKRPQSALFVFIICHITFASLLFGWNLLRWNSIVTITTNFHWISIEFPLNFHWMINCQSYTDLKKFKIRSFYYHCCPVKIFNNLIKHRKHTEYGCFRAGSIWNRIRFSTITHRALVPLQRGSLRSLETQRAQRLFVLLFSVERTKNNKKRALRAFRV